MTLHGKNHCLKNNSIFSISRTKWNINTIKVTGSKNRAFWGNCFSSSKMMTNIWIFDMPYLFKTFFYLNTISKKFRMLMERLSAQSYNFTTPRQHKAILQLYNTQGKGINTLLFWEASMTATSHRIKCKPSLHGCRDAEKLGRTCYVCIQNEIIVLINVFFLLTDRILVVAVFVRQHLNTSWFQLNRLFHWNKTKQKCFP